ncbi:ribonuclease subunit b [Ophiostoma piceae UAMH 11346]|uniref:Ribonuclease H2 subunit B n=1 Tax=Ophiostoma piceae (strain UAMH 11346) TaxID=1262450 RepID=S3BXJ2_OPHP1|nr:ribonuclease subunit b [Ophiostoma piceae UAMH 11346]
MPPRTTRNTRAKGAATDDAPAATTSTAKYILEAETDNPPRLFVLPKKVTADARIVTLPHPRHTLKPARFLVCPETGVYEFTQIANPKTEPRSWLLGVDKSEDESLPAQTTKDADLFVATAVDPLFLILPALFAEPASTDDDDEEEDVEYRKARRPSTRKRMFLTADDHFDALPKTGGSHLAQLLRSQPVVQAIFTKRMAVVCDTVAAGDETMYRLNEDKLLLELLAKAQRTGSSHTKLPPTLEAKFVTKALEAPIQGMRSAAAPQLVSSVSATSSASTGASTPMSTADSVDSEGATSFTSTSSASTVPTAVSDEADAHLSTTAQVPEEVVALQRLRVAFQFICSRYVPVAITRLLQQKLKDSPESGGVDFAPLDAHLANIEALRKAAVLARSAAMSYSGNNKRSLESEEAEDRAEKKRRLQEEEKRKKASESRGVRNLKKVNVTGMKKMSDFFKKA